MFLTFWISLALVAFVYAGYPVIAALGARWSRMRGKGMNPGSMADADLPDVTLVVACFNEADILADKVQNCRELDYPKEKLRVLFVTDGSNDGSEQLLATMPGVEVTHQPERRGKLHAVKRVMKMITSPVTVFCDANTFLNPESMRLLARHFADPAVGAVAGEKQVKASGEKATAGEGLYWKYESKLKFWDAHWHTVVGAAGELFAVRTTVAPEPPDDSIIEDFMVTLTIAGNGYRVAYEPEATATEGPSASLGDEWKRKVRIAAGGWQAMSRLGHLMNPFKYGVLAFQFAVHRASRWTVAPMALVTLLLANIGLALTEGGFYTAILAAQGLFYALSYWGWKVQGKPAPFPGFFFPSYFTMMHLAGLAGGMRFFRGKQQVTWEKARRDQSDSLIGKAV